MAGRDEFSKLVHTTKSRGSLSDCYPANSLACRGNQTTLLAGYPIAGHDLNRLKISKCPAVEIVYRFVRKCKAIVKIILDL